MIQRVLVPLDGSRLAERALRVAGDLTESLSGTLIVARVVPPAPQAGSLTPGLIEQLEAAHNDEAAAYLNAIADRLRADRLQVKTRLLHGQPASELIAVATEESCDLIAISSHGMSGLGSQVFGSGAQKLLYAAPCPVLVVRSTAEDLTREEEQEEQAADTALLERIAAAEPKPTGA
jgi:nucleotide-binding universal stress UspA family protein